MTFPNEILAQHSAVLGKTGSGKTSTAKLLIEQVVAEGARVCVLDPIKSDWWGLTSSRDGKKAGLPFHILGGPRGHVPLHASAGKVIGEIVANGALPLSIIDMADFEPGGQAKFFTDFAPTLLRKMRGVVYLVIEEAHLFAPKERSGIGAENLSIHWAKTLATAGRSKGVRLVLVTQRTQALHNALLGSCDTMIVHRLTAPADQEPVIKWLKANVQDAAIRDQVVHGMSSLKTGSGWLCSGEAKVFELIHFPRIHTYDNTATPTGDGDVREIKTAPVDREKLGAIIGDAVKEAQANDPKELRKEVARLQQELTKAQQVKPVAPASIKSVEKRVEVLTDTDRALLVKVEQRFTDTRAALLSDIEALFQKAALDSTAVFEGRRKVFIDTLDSKGFQKILGKLSTLKSEDSRRPAVPRAEPSGRSSAATRPNETRAPRGTDGSGAAGDLPPARQKILNGLAFLHGIGVLQVDKTQLALIVGVSPSSGSYFNNLGALRTAGLLEYPTGGTVALTSEGADLASVDGVPSTTRDLHDAIRAKLPPAKWKILEALIRVYPASLTKHALAEQIAVAPTSGSYFNNLGSLRSLGLISYPRPAEAAAQPVLFLEN